MIRSVIPRENAWGDAQILESGVRSSPRRAGSFPEQWLVIEPKISTHLLCKMYVD